MEKSKKRIATKVKGTEVLELSKPLDIDGTKYTTITFDFDSLTGQDINSAELELKLKGVEITTMHELCKPYLFVIAAKASRINVEYLESLPIKDASKITVLVQSFLLG